MHQFNGVENHLKRSLDLVLSNMEPNKINLSQSLDSIAPIDRHHPPLLIEVDVEPLAFLEENRLPKYNFFRANYEELANLLNAINWVSLFERLSIDEAVREFYCTLSTLLKAVPKTRGFKTSFPCWFTFELIRLIRKKTVLHNVLKDKKRCGIATDEDYSNFSDTRKAVKDLREECHRIYIADIESKLSVNTKCFFSYTKSMKKSNSLPNCVQYNETVASDRQSICNLFADYFASVYDNSGLSRVDIDRFAPDFIFQNITNAEVSDILSKLDQYKVSSPDQIPAIFYRKLSASISEPLAILFNKSISEKKFPTVWKESFLTPVFKSGNKCKAENYRPISILCAASKIFERLAFIRLYNHVKEYISADQHGFVPGRSTLSNLLVYVNNVVKFIENGGQVDTLYTDFSKAFDKISHEILMNKLSSFGVNGACLEWFRTYLIDRNQCVVIGSTKSHVITPTSGIPQGSILGPLLFLIYINDLPAIFASSKCALLADDLKLYKKITAEQDCHEMQKDIDALSNWCDNNSLSLNIPKCFTLTTTLKPNPITFSYTIRDATVTKVDVKSDLGVTFDSKQSYKHHFDVTTRKCYQMLGFIFRSSKYFIDHKSIIRLYYAYVRSRLDYCCTVWNPQYVKYVDQIERVQKKFTRMLYYKFNWVKPDYKTR